MPRTLTTCAQAAATIRSDLKYLHRISSRQVSVKAHNYSMGSAIYVTINDPAVDIREVKNIANKHQHVRRDEQGEVLSGGNQHLFVEYADEAAEKLAVSEAETIAALLKDVPATGSGSGGKRVGDLCLFRNDDLGLDLHLMKFPYTKAAVYEGQGQAIGIAKAMLRIRARA